MIQLTLVKTVAQQSFSDHINEIRIKPDHATDCPKSNWFVPFYFCDYRYKLALDNANNQVGWPAWSNQVGKQ